MWTEDAAAEVEDFLVDMSLVYHNIGKRRLTIRRMNDGEEETGVGHDLTARQRFTAYWILVFVAGRGFGAITGYEWGQNGLWWWPLW